MGQSRLNAVSMLSIEKKFLQKISNFNDLVIIRFAEAKNRRAELLFK